MYHKRVADDEIARSLAAMDSTFSWEFSAPCRVLLKSSDHQAEPKAHSGGMAGGPAMAV